MKRREIIMLLAGALYLRRNPAGYVDRILHDADPGQISYVRHSAAARLCAQRRIKDDVSFARRPNDHSRHRLRTRAHDGGARRSCMKVLVDGEPPSPRTAPSRTVIPFLQLSPPRLSRMPKPRM